MDMLRKVWFGRDTGPRRNLADLAFPLACGDRGHAYIAAREE